jgi:hypothetical protein
MTVKPKYSQMREAGHEIDLQPVFKQNWKTTESRDYWEPVLSPFDKLKYEISGEQVISEDHPRTGGFHLVSPDELAETFAWCAENGLLFQEVRTVTVEGSVEAVSNRNVDLVPGGKAETEAAEVERKAIVTAQNNDDLQNLIGFAQSLDNSDTAYYENMVYGVNVEKFVRADGFERVAPIFGIPECCAEFVVDLDWNTGTFDPMYEIACNTPSAVIENDDHEDIVIEDPDPMLNIFWSYLDWSFINHFPCSFECEHSHDVAIKTGKTLREMGEDTAAELMHKWLGLPMVWSGYNSIAKLRNAYGIGSYITADYWDRRRIVWGEEHDLKPELSSVQLPVRDW